MEQKLWTNLIINSFSKKNVRQNCEGPKTFYVIYEKNIFGLSS
jgi:hypothetical protein